MARYMNGQMRKLRGEMRYASPGALRRQVARIKRLLPTLSSGAVYPYEYVVEKVTGFRPQHAGTVELRGETLIPDLRRFLYDISGRAGLRADEAGEKVLRFQEVCERYSVSPRTIARWRENGLVAMKFVWPDGSKRTGIEQRVLEEYVKRNAASVERSSRFSRMTDEERQAVIERARIYACDWGMGPSQVVQRLSDELGRSREAIRYTLWNHDRDHHSIPIFDSWREPLTNKQVAAIQAAFAAGTSVAELARRFTRTPSAIYQMLRMARARRLLARRIEHVPNPLYESRTADQEILGLGVVHEPSPGKPARGDLDVEDASTQTCSIYGPQLLSKEEEKQLFLKYNYLKFRALRLQAQLAVGYAPQRTMDELERLLAEAERIRERLVHAYLRLVISVAHRHEGRNAPLHDLVSEGNMCLLRALEKFDVSRGNRFSTYLTWSLLKTYARTIPEANRASAKFVTGHEGFMESAGVPGETSEPGDEKETRERVVSDILHRLSRREREVVASRFGLDAAAGASYGEIGKRLGVSKERARQIQGAAMRKLREQLAGSPQRFKGAEKP